MGLGVHYGEEGLCAFAQLHHALHICLGQPLQVRPVLACGVCAHKFCLQPFVEEKRLPEDLPPHHIKRTLQDAMPANGNLQALLIQFTL